MGLCDFDGYGVTFVLCFQKHVGDAPLPVCGVQHFADGAVLAHEDAAGGVILDAIDFVGPGLFIVVQVEAAFGQVNSVQFFKCFLTYFFHL